MGTVRHIILMHSIWVITSLLVGYSHEQGTGSGALGASYGGSSQAAPLVGQRQSRIPSQQVIVPGGFQHQLFPNQYSNVRGVNPRLVQQSPISIQNQQFAFLPRDPYARSLQGRAPTSAAALVSAKPTSSRSLSPNFVEIVSPNPKQLVSSSLSSGQVQSAASTSPQFNGNSRSTDVQYEYYDETDGDLLYQYGNDFNEPNNSGQSPSSNRQPGQYFTEISPPKSGGRNSKINAFTRNPSPIVGSTENKRSQGVRLPSPSSSQQPAPSPTGGSSAQQPTKSVFPSGTANNRLFRQNRPSPFSSSASNSAQVSKETSSSFIPLVDESEEPDQGLALNGRSVHSTSHRGNTLSVRPPLGLLRSSTTEAPESSNSSQQSSSGVSEKPATKTPTRNRALFSRPAPKSSSSSERNSSVVSSRRPAAVLRGNANSSSANRLNATSRAPIIIRPRNLPRTSGSKTKDNALNSSLKEKSDPNTDQTGAGSSENPKANSLPSVEDYTVEYVEYPFNNDDNSSVVEYYEVSEETAQALLQRAKAKANHRKSLDHSHPIKHNVSSSSSSSTSSRNASGGSSNESSATKVTVSVSSKSSYSSTTTSTTSTTSTTPAPPEASSEENVSGQIDPSGEVVISVATTRSVSGVKGAGSYVTEAPQHGITTPTPRVTFSKATGSSFVVASVQTSRSVGKGQHRQNHGSRSSKTIHGDGVKDSMPSGAETAPEYYEEEYTYPDNYPVLNSENGEHRNDDHEDEPTSQQQDNYNPNEYSHEVSLQSPAITPTKSVHDAESSNRNPSSSSVQNSTQRKESSEASSVVKNSSDDEAYDDESGSHAPQPRKLPSKKGEIPLNHFETLVDDVSELEQDHPLHTVNQEDLSPPSEEDSFPNIALAPATPLPVLTTSTARTTTTPVPQVTTEKIIKKDPTSILSSIRFAEVSPDFLPPGFKLPSAETPTSSSEAIASTTTTTTTTTTQAPATNGKAFGIQFEEINLSALLPKGYKPRPTPVKSALPTTTTTTTEKPKAVSKDPLEALKIQFKEIVIPGLIPKDYTPPPSEQPEPAKESNATSVLAGIRFETPSNLLPPGYKPPAASPSPAQPVVPIRFETPGNLLPKGYKPPGSQSVEPIKFELPPNLLPPGYKPPSPSSSESLPSPSSTEASGTNDSGSPSSTKKPGGLVFPTKPGGLVFPTKPGGVRVTRPTTTEAPKGDTPPPPAVRIATGWPTRKTTEFTGWPTPSTTPMPPTSSTTTTTTTEAPTTTTATTTTTTPTPKRSPAGSCPKGICRMEATIRIVGGVKWVPEFQDVNTDEYKHLETTVKRELDGAYRSSGLAPWYRKVEIEGFNRGSVIVDYFLLLDGIDRELSTDYVVRQFHKSLLDSADELPFYDDSPDQLVSNGRLRFGRYTIDPRYSDFKVVNITKDSGPLAQDPLIPQWGIAVIVIGLASLLFVVIFGVTVLVNRHKNSKKKNAVSLTQEMLSEFNKSHMGSGAGGLDNYGADDLYNMDDVWNDKQMDKTFDRKPTKRSQGSGKGSANYNIYDSWKTEWNGYYYNGNYYGDSGYAPSRRRSDYDTTF